MNEESLNLIVNQIRDEQHISPFIKDEIIKGFVLDGIYDINESSGAMIDYNEDLIARRLLKNYVMYANNNRLAEFKQLYYSDYAKLQANYY